LTKFIRHFHRWVSIAFVLGFLINAVVISTSPGGVPPSWIYLLALIPLFLLLATGVWMLGVHYGQKMARNKEVAA
jgi:hypothetical protein